MQPLWLQGLFFGEERKPHNLITNMIRSKHLLLIVFRKVCEVMKHIKYFLSIMAVLVLLTGCSEKSETSGKEEKGDQERTVDASAATEQVQAEETKPVAQAPAEATEQSAAPSGESNSAEDTNKAASSSTAASTNETSSPNAAVSVKQTQESSSNQAASTQTTASQPSQGSAASQSPQAPAAAPSQAASEPQQEQKKETATVTLSIRDNGTMILSKTTVELQEGDTVFTVLARTVRNKGIQMEYTGSGQSVYIQGINNLYEMDRGPKSGWRYSVNGVLADRSAGVFKLSKGDKVEWRYTNDYKKDGQ